ncbi:MAG: hypothetical protein AAF458_07625 [Pseudomonadota bacterium]
MHQNAEERRQGTELQSWRERLGEPPREAVAAQLRGYWRHDNRRWRNVTIIGVFLCALAFIIAFPWPLLATMELDWRGETTEGLVVASRFQHRGLGPHMFMRKRSIYGTRFRYRDASGTVRDGFNLDTREWSAGERVTVEYLGDGSAARIEGGFFVSGGYWAGIWTCLFPGLALFGVWNYRRSVNRHRDLVRFGKLAMADIEQIWIDGSPDRANGWVALRLDTPAGGIQLTQSLQGNALQRAQTLIKAGRRVVVLHHANQPRECILLDLLPPLPGRG